MAWPPSPALVTSTLATLYSAHIYRVQSAFPAELLQVSDYDTLTVGIDEAGVSLEAQLASSIVTGPAPVTADPTMRDCHHVSVVQPMFATEGGKVCDWTCGPTLRIDEAIIGLDVFPFARAVAV